MKSFMPDLFYMSFKAVSTITFVAKAETNSAANAVVAYISLLAPLMAQLDFCFLQHEWPEGSLVISYFIKWWVFPIASFQLWTACFSDCGAKSEDRSHIPLFKGSLSLTMGMIPRGKSGQIMMNLQCLVCVMQKLEMMMTLWWQVGMHP